MSRTEYDIPIGAEIAGTYYGTPIRGTVIGVRAHSIRWDVREVRVQLEAPATLLGVERERLLIYDDWAGNPVPGFEGGVITYVEVAP